ncbi:hypothetical protein [Agrobacterium fabrum]|uniref:hypothetical protein n=1 Tax=Agrobacterium fabrum TaxID=1176649 RepID=UPI00215721F8|nr:hypothetical protein [Agrobacterium fabrum]MCR6725979.1 hypothetical protein [Agrobacterium fabrum]
MRMTVHEEMRLDPDGIIFNDQLHANYLAKHKEALDRQQALLKSLLYADVALAILLFGKDIKLPLVDLNLSDIPAAIQVVAFISSISFLLMSYAFLNAQLYQAISEQFDIRRASKLGVDSDFISAANIYTELWLKAFRKQMHHGGIDFFRAPKAYSIYYGIITTVGLLAVLSIVGLHLGSLLYSLWFTWENKVWWWGFTFAVFTMNLAALLVNSLLSFPFAIDASEPLPPLPDKGE